MIRCLISYIHRYAFSFGFLHIIKSAHFHVRESLVCVYFITNATPFVNLIAGRILYQI